MMQIELMGCTSAGKSVLISELLRTDSELELGIVQGDDFILRKLHLVWATRFLSRGCLVNMVALLACLITWRKNGRFYCFAARMLAESSIGRREKFYLFRNILKKTGAYEIIGHLQSDRQVIVVDEGVLQIAHNLFVHGTDQTDNDKLSTFVGLISMPDVIVYLRQPQSLLIERIMQRGHARLPDRSRDNAARFVGQASAVFEELIRYPAVARRLVIVDRIRQVAIGADMAPIHR